MNKVEKKTIKALRELFDIFEEVRNDLEAREIFKNIEVRFPAEIADMISYEEEQIYEITKELDVEKELAIDIYENSREKNNPCGTLIYDDEQIAYDLVRGKISRVGVDKESGHISISIKKSEKNYKNLSLFERSVVEALNEIAGLMKPKEIEWAPITAISSEAAEEIKNALAAEKELVVFEDPRTETNATDQLAECEDAEKATIGINPESVLKEFADHRKYVISKLIEWAKEKGVSYLGAMEEMERLTEKSNKENDQSNEWYFKSIAIRDALDALNVEIHKYRDSIIEEPIEKIGKRP